MNARNGPVAAAVARRWADLAAGDVMTTPVVTVTPQTTILGAIRLLLDRSISGMPVVDSDGELVGIVTEKDLLVGEHLLAADKVPVSLVMTHDVIAVNEDAGLGEVTQALVHRGFKRLPVVKEGKVSGIVARRDVLRTIEELS